MQRSLRCIASIGTLCLLLLSFSEVHSSRVSGRIAALQTALRYILDHLITRHGKGKEFKRMGELRVRSTHAQPTVRSKPSTSSIAGLESALTQTSLHDMAVELPVIRSSDSALSAFHVLDDDQDVVLFTPAIRSSSNQAMDPFEPLGRGLSQHHVRVRHVPYIPKHGMTETHTDFLEHAGAAIVVLCDLPPSSKVATELYKQQHDFARLVVQMSDEIPTLVVLISPSSHTSSTSGFGTVLHIASCSPPALRGIAQSIFH